MHQDHYFYTRKEGLRIAADLRARGIDPALPVLNEMLPNINKMSQVPLGLCQIPLNMIEGTVTSGRTLAFTRGFYPLLEVGTEFANKWTILYDDIVREGLREPVKALEYYNHYYIIEGNKRVSVMKRLDAAMIEAHVTRVMPLPEDSERYRVYQEYLRFYEDTRINSVCFDHEGDYARLYALTGKTQGVRWEREAVFDLESCYYRFSQAYHEVAGTKPPMSMCDAFLIYLEVMGYEASTSKTPNEFKQDMRKLWPEFIVAGANKPAALLSEPGEKQQSILSSVWRRPPNPLRCAFVYNHSPLVGAWTYGHELGRKALEQTFGARIETTSREDVDPQDAGKVIDELAKEGYHVIFTASPVFLGACIKQSVVHPETKILNCSLLASYHNVRSYYLRIYEAKFILGAIAGAMASDDKIGYIADYPIYGVPASINAFALGAQMTNPRAKIFLEWSSLPGRNPEKALDEQDVHIISSRDISAPQMESRNFGLYEKHGEQISSLAAPMWNWSRCYQGIVRSILSGAWTEDQQLNADRALSYYMGMSSDAIDLITSQRVPVRVRRLVDLLHERIRSGSLLPLVGPIADQNGVIRAEEGVALTPQEIISMDYLADNVVGRLPECEELLPVAQALVSLQGIGKGQRPIADVKAKDE
ncbi:MAG: BMP family ABC transporter substrate-binding protein [Clostridia bacterium]|nr:BMP family ABC transporter substrate-binding protein [Clostridia bacterium]